MRVNLSPEIGRLTDEALQLSASRGAGYVGVEHLFEVLVINYSLLPRGIRERRIDVLRQIQQITAAARWKGSRNGGFDVHYTPRAAAVLTEAGHIAKRLRSGQANAGHLLLALLSDPAALPSRVMDRYRVPREEMVEEIQSELLSQSGMLSSPPRELPAPSPASPPEKPDPPASDRPTQALPKGGEKESSEEVRIEAFLRDLTAAARGQATNAVGRERETMEILQVLTRHGKNNVVLVGEPGVGKTKIVEALAGQLDSGDFGSMLAGKRILELNIAAMMSGTKYRGVLEEKLLKLVDDLESRRDTILFVDELHLIMGAGATEDGSLDIANILKPVLGRGKILCIGATTTDEFQQFLAKDPAIERRFHVIRVQPLSVKATLQVLEELRPHLQVHHRLNVPTDVLKAAIVLAEQYLPNRQLPDKAIDVLDQACSRCRLKTVLAQSNPDLLKNTVAPDRSGGVTVRDVQRVIEEMAGVKIVDGGSGGALDFTQLGEYLNRYVIGQEHAVEQVVGALQRAEAGLSDPDKPSAVLFFLGPSGVGKTQLARRLAKGYRAASNLFTLFDMSEYSERESVSRLIGVPPGYAGSDRDGALIRAVRQNPSSILVFDEIEKAHPSIFDILLPVMDEGRLHDARNQTVRFNDAILIFTSNVGAELIAATRGSAPADRLRECLRGTFRPEFVNRVDELVVFAPLRRRDLAGILRVMIDEVRHRLKRKGIGVRMYKDAYEFLAERGYSREYGARELRRCVEQHVMTPIAESVLRGDYRSGDMIDVQQGRAGLVLSKGRPHVPRTDTRMRALKANAGAEA